MFVIDQIQFTCADDLDRNLMVAMKRKIHRAEAIPTKLNNYTAQDTLPYMIIDQQKAQLVPQRTL